MGKTYFNLVDGLNFNGNEIKIKGCSVQPLEKQVTSGSAIFRTDLGHLYQSVLASQPQMCSLGTVNGVSPEAYLSVMNSSPQVARISIERNEKDGYVTKTNSNLNKVSMRNASANSAKVENTELIVVAGLQVAGSFKYQFIETALHDIDVLIEKGVSPSDITWIVFWNSSVYQDFDLDNFQETADSLGINMEYVENKKQFINYINFKNKQGGGVARNDTKISYMSIFGHGQTPLFTGGTETQLSFGYNLDLTENLEKTINFVQSDIEQLKSASFYTNPLTYFYTCNTGTAGKDGLRFAQLWANKTQGYTWAFTNARSNYIFINSSMDAIGIAFNLPGNKIDFAVSDIINGLRAEGASLSTEALTEIFGEQNRETVKYISEHILFYPVSEEWRLKKARADDRLRKDNNGNKYGYADKGSLQYPMINNIGDDMDIILGTLGQPRGFKMFTPCLGIGDSYPYIENLFT